MTVLKVFTCVNISQFFIFFKITILCVKQTVSYKVLNRKKLRMETTTNTTKEKNSLYLQTEIPPTIQRNLVHKNFDKNVLISDIKKIKNKEDTYMGQCIIKKQHEFFFEHERNHIPGIYLIEAARQTALATGHKFYNIPLNWLFIINSMKIDFTSITSLDKTIYIKSIVNNKRYRKNILSKAEGTSVFIQDGKEIARMSGNWKIISNKIAKRYNYS